MKPAAAAAAATPAKPATVSTSIECAVGQRAATSTRCSPSPSRVESSVHFACGPGQRTWPAHTGDAIGGHSEQRYELPRRLGLLARRGHIAPWNLAA